MYNSDESFLEPSLTLQKLPSSIRVRVEEPSNNEVFARILRDHDWCRPASSLPPLAFFLFYSTPLPISFQNSPLCRLLCPCGCAYLVAHQPKTTLMYISPPPLKGDKSSAMHLTGKVKSRRAIVHVCIHLHSCFFIDPSGCWAVFMQMRQHLNICPKQLTWNKCLAAQKHGRVRTDFFLFFGGFSFLPRLPGSWAFYRRPESWLWHCAIYTAPQTFKRGMLNAVRLSRKVVGWMFILVSPENPFHRQSP